jgi:hypothetical protein
LRSPLASGYGAAANDRETAVSRMIAAALADNSPARTRCARMRAFGGLAMHVLAVSLIGLGVASGCWAIILLLLDNRARRINERSFRENLDEIDRQLREARRERGDLS